MASSWAQASNLFPALKDMGFSEKRIETCLNVLLSSSNGFEVSLEAAVEWYKETVNTKYMYISAVCMLSVSKGRDIPFLV